jgi:hypothetical protein
MRYFNSNVVNKINGKQCWVNTNSSVDKHMENVKIHHSEKINSHIVILIKKTLNLLFYDLKKYIYT